MKKEIIYNGQRCIVISVLFRKDVLRQYYSVHQLAPWSGHSPKSLVLADHPLQESLFNSFLPCLNWRTPYLPRPDLVDSIKRHLKIHLADG